MTWKSPTPCIVAIRKYLINYTSTLIYISLSARSTLILIRCDWCRLNLRYWSNEDPSLELRIYDLLEDHQQLLLRDVPVCIRINSAHELLDVLVGNLPRVVHISEGVADHLLHLLVIKHIVSVLVVPVENEVDRLSELIVSGLEEHRRHFKYYLL